MPYACPIEFREDLCRVARSREPAVTSTCINPKPQTGDRKIYGLLWFPGESRHVV